MDRDRLMTRIGGCALGCCGLLWVLSYVYPSPTATWPVPSDRSNRWIASNHGRVSIAYISERAFISGRTTNLFYPIRSWKPFWRYQLPEYWEENVVTFIGGHDRGFRTTG